MYQKSCIIIEIRNKSQEISEYNFSLWLREVHRPYPNRDYVECYERSLTFQEKLKILLSIFCYLYNNLCDELIGNFTQEANPF